ncbi:putative Peptidase S10, serine carboxypeptidase; putative signal peptide [Bradyrhizobium sp. ORS 278]|uniref:S10 family peptidase n=1 Tax=Bradyrhizobium sp. (strain ORS 278) TaxID=114615 RepID=UPI0001508202|nr:peptidase S10 [Bradyrhizobium sp. ORS 278]CAL76799.1 putative Peptidase S10, serine carboxypeptidase; putative signal peptide [Bradyrhizobium sp. ORS 278]
MPGLTSSIVRPSLLAIALTLLGAGPALRAQDAPPAAQENAAASGPRGGSAGTRVASAPASPSAAEQHKLPADSTTTQTVDLPGRTLTFTATAGSIRLFDDKGEPQADIAYTSYQLNGTERGSRPVTFFLNGGPGASSAYLQLGNAGPWRIGIDAASVTPSSKPELTPNADTWLDFTDLVFIDPVGTGYSRFVATGDEVRKRFFSVDGDVRSLSQVMRRWLEKHDRLASPKFITAESYGGIRGPKIVRNLQQDQGVGINGLILLSPLLDFRDYSGSSLLQYVASLPSYAAVARQMKGPVTRADLAEVERYASGDFLLDLVKGEADTEATNRLADQVAALTGIDQAVSRRLAGRFDDSEFRREFDRKNGRVTGRYDGSVLGIDPFPDSSRSRSSDPSGDVLTAPLTGAAVELTTRKLNWRPDGSYELLSGAVNQSWDFGRGISPPESSSDIRQILALDPKLKLLVGHGLFDLATPYYGSKIVLDQLPAFAQPPRVKLVVYPGGHMFYSRDDARKAFRGEAEALMK